MEKENKGELKMCTKRDFIAENAIDISYFIYDNSNMVIAIFEENTLESELDMIPKKEFENKIAILKTAYDKLKKINNSLLCELDELKNPKPTRGQIFKKQYPDANLKFMLPCKLGLIPSERKECECHKTQTCDPMIDWNAKTLFDEKQEA